MSRLLHFLLVVFIFFGLNSCQQPEQGSSKQNRAVRQLSELHLNAITLGTPLKDTIAIKQQIGRADTLWVNDPYRAQKLLWEAARASYQLHYPNGIINAFSPIASKYFSLNKVDSALFYYNLMTYATLQLPPELVLTELIYANIGVLYYRQGMFDSAFNYLYNAVNPLKSYTIPDKNSWNNVYEIYLIAGSMWLNAGDAETALPYVNEAKNIADSLKDSGKIMQIKHFAATIHFRKKSYDTALALYREILNEKASPDDIKVQALNNISAIYIKRKNCDPDSALHYAQKAVELSHQLYGNDSTKGLGERYTLACAYAHKGEHDKDTSNFRKSEEILLQLNDHQLSSIIAGGELVNFYAGQASFAAVNHKNFERAYQLTQKALRLRDSLYSKEILQQSAKMDALYRITQKDKSLAQKQVQLMSAEKKVIEKNVLLLYMTSIALFLIVLSFWRHLYIRQKNQRLASARETEVLQAKLNAEEQERERISYDLHDSINSRLASTQSFLIALQQGHSFLKDENDFKRIAQNLNDISTDVRQIAHNLAPPDLLSKKLPCAIRDFCTDLLTPRGIACEVRVLGNFEDVPMDYCLTFYRITQELVHNILKHAEATEVIVMLAYQDGMVSLLVEDNGNGMEWSDANKEQKGIGLLGLQNRVKSLNGILHKEVRRGDGTTIHITAKCPSTFAKLKKTRKKDDTNR